jgi:hypothetical protein
MAIYIHVLHITVQKSRQLLQAYPQFSVPNEKSLLPMAPEKFEIFEAVRIYVVTFGLSHRVVRYHFSGIIFYLNLLT